MGSSKEYLEYVLEQLSDLDDISYRAMMGEYIIYYRGKIVGNVSRSVNPPYVGKRGLVAGLRKQDLSRR